jgi:predicted NBD/HSP70 family sugar kinase
MKTTIGFDIGGSSIKSVIYNDGKIIFRYSENIQGINEASKLAKLVAKILSRMVQEKKAGRKDSVGIAVAGIFDKKREIMLRSPNISYLNGLNLKTIFKEHLEHDFFLENDANCFLLREKINGLAKNLENVFCLTLGTGIGGARLLDNKIYMGFNGSAGEAGHMLIDKKEELDFEDLASEKLLKKELNIDAQEAKKLADSGDQQTLALLKVFGRNLGIGVANIVNICDPQIVIIGGGCSQLKNYLLPAVRKVMSEKVISNLAKNTKVAFAWENEKSIFFGAEGAAIMAQEAKKFFS